MPIEKRRSSAASSAVVVTEANSDKNNNNNNEEKMEEPQNESDEEFPGEFPIKQQNSDTASTKQQNSLKKGFFDGIGPILEKEIQSFVFLLFVCLSVCFNMCLFLGVLADISV